MANLILVGVDGSDSSMIAGRRAAELAVAFKSKLVVLTAFQGENAEGSSPRVFEDSVEQTMARLERAEAKMRNIAARAEDTANQAADELRDIAPNVEAVVQHAKADDAILAEANRLEANLIVVGNRNMQGLKRVLGSVPNAVSHNAPCDVYIVKTI